uniref:Mediator of RNA polymerase II transcription subunit 7 n=1 Tax=Mycena chlorophos TaxID=658473 RepID=A0ABQ0KVE9_MYCCL|nr:predicted protein [Mycena chlorophos]
MSKDAPVRFDQPPQTNQPGQSSEYDRYLLWLFEFGQQSAPATVSWARYQTDGEYVERAWADAEGVERAQSGQVLIKANPRRPPRRAPSSNALVSRAKTRPELSPTRPSTVMPPEDPYMALLDGMAKLSGELIESATNHEKAATRQLAQLSALAHTQNFMAERLRVAEAEIQEALSMVGTMHDQAPTLELKLRGGMSDGLERLSKEIRAIRATMDGRQRALENERTMVTERRRDAMAEIAELCREEVEMLGEEASD